MRTSRYLVVLAVTIPLAAGGCPAEQVPEALSGLVEVESLSIPAGEVVRVTGDLDLLATGDVAIDGELIADGQGPWDVSISAGGDIVVSGTLRAGSGSTGEPGGSVLLRSTGGDLTLGAAAVVAAGSGAPGVVDAQTLGQGFDGGGVGLFAPAGTLAVAAGAEVVVGRGGDGASVMVQPGDLPEGAIALCPSNGGGDGGAIDFDAATIQGIDFEELVAEADWPEGSEDPVIGAGETYRVLADGGPFVGGEGGAAGETAYGDEDGVSNWPPGLAPPECPTDGSEQRGGPGTVEVRGAGGGDSRTAPSEGGPARAIARTPGQGAGAWGGEGGSCLPPFLDACDPAPGGSATATAAAGADATEPGAPGQDGGRANATAGLVGIDVHIGEPPTLTCPQAVATGGAGGRGGGRCAGPVRDAGGNGGTGGDAEADVPDHSLDPGHFTCSTGSGTARAVGGKGGDGGDGLSAPGAGRPSGDAIAASVANNRALALRFPPGRPGDLCDVCPETSDPAADGLRLDGASWVDSPLHPQADIRTVVIGEPVDDEIGVVRVEIGTEDEIVPYEWDFGAPLQFEVVVKAPGAGCAGAAVGVGAAGTVEAGAILRFGAEIDAGLPVAPLPVEAHGAAGWTPTGQPLDVGYEDGLLQIGLGMDAALGVASSVSACAPLDPSTLRVVVVAVDPSQAPGPSIDVFGGMVPEAAGDVPGGLWIPECHAPIAGDDDDSSGGDDDVGDDDDSSGDDDDSEPPGFVLSDPTGDGYDALWPYGNFAVDPEADLVLAEGTVEPVPTEMLSLCLASALPYGSAPDGLAIDVLLADLTETQGQPADFYPTSLDLGIRRVHADLESSTWALTEMQYLSVSGWTVTAAWTEPAQAIFCTGLSFAGLPGGLGLADLGLRVLAQNASGMDSIPDPNQAPPEWTEIPLSGL